MKAGVKKSLLTQFYLNHEAQIHIYKYIDIYILKDNLQ